MLIYLDQVRSIGPESACSEGAPRRRPRAQARPQREPRARDPRAAHDRRSQRLQPGRRHRARARAHRLERRRAAAPVRARRGSSRAASSFVAALHEPGARHVLGERYEAAAKGRRSPSCAGSPSRRRRRATSPTKLARHFAGDAPPPALVDRLANAFLRSGGDLPTVYRALIDSPEAWAARAGQVQDAVGVDAVGAARPRLARPRGQELAPMLRQLGQPTWRPGFAGRFDDTAASWAAPDALMRRVELAQRFAARAGAAHDARVLAPQLLAGGVSAATEIAIARADSPATALALLLASPEFLRR
jgi:uncharacterized protein (DUF1800 family)